jgi:hypothetical protein
MHAPHAEAALAQDVVDASRILFHQGIVDAFGHVGARSAHNPQRFYLSRNRAPGLVTAADGVRGSSPCATCAGFLGAGPPLFETRKPP